MHPLFMNELVEQRQCDLFEEAGGGCAKAPRISARKGKLRQALARRRGRGTGSCTDC